jgi:hypothetical protein
MRSLPDALRPAIPRLVRARLGDTTADVQGPAWKRWVRGRLFACDLNLLAVRDAQEWSPADMATLQLLVTPVREGGLRPKGRSLVLILHTASRGTVDRGLLRPLLGNDTAALEALEGMRLAVGAAPEPLTLAPRIGAPGDAAALLGVDERAQGRKASLRRNLRDRRWSPSDLLPMLAIGSTPHLPFRITRFANESADVFARPLADLLLPYVRFFEGNPRRKLKLLHDAELLRTITSEAGRSGIVHVVGRSHAEQEYVDLVGQPGRRQLLADALVGVFDNEAARRRYLARLLGCGVLHALNTCRDAAPAGKAMDSGSLRRTLGALRSAAQLWSEIDAMGGLDAARQDGLRAAQNGVAAALADARIVPKSEALRLASIVSCRAHAMGLLDASHALTGSASEGLVGALVTRLNQARTLRSGLDVAVAAERAQLSLRREIREADADLAARLRNAIEDGAQDRKLERLIPEAQDADALRGLLRHHHALGPVVQSIVWRQVAGQNDLDLQLRAARIMATLRDRGAPFLETSRDRAIEAVPLEPAYAERMIGWLEQPETVKLLAERLSSLEGDTIPDVELGYLDPADQEVAREVKIVMETG